MGESDYAFQAAVKDLRVGHLAEQVEAVIAQVLEVRKLVGHRGAGFVFWQELQLRVHIDWNDPVVAHAACCRVKYVRLLQNKASSPCASGANGDGLCYWVQLVVEGVPLHKPKHQGGKGQVGADLGPSTYAVLAQEGEARLDEFCAAALEEQLGV
jgi:hypothetical protein